MDINLRRFDPKTIPLGSVCVWVGKRHSGKSTNMFYVLYTRRRKSNEATIFSNTNESSGDCDGHFPQSFIHDEYKPNVVDEIMEMQEERVAEVGKYDARWHTLILEDLFFDKETIHRHKTFKQILMNGRHKCIDGPMYAVHYLMDFPKAFRQQVDYWFIMGDNSHSNRESIWKQLFGVIPNLKLFNDIMDACTENYSAMVLNTRSLSRDIADCVFWMRAPKELPNRWHFGDQSYWLFDQVNGRKKPKKQPRKLSTSSRNPNNPRVRRRV